MCVDSAHEMENWRCSTLHTGARVAALTSLISEIRCAHNRLSKSQMVSLRASFFLVILDRLVHTGTPRSTKGTYAT